MTLFDNTPHYGTAPKIDRNIIKWSGYYTTSEEAQKYLEEQTKQFAVTENKLVVSSKKELVNRHFKGYFLYQFCVVLTEKR